MKTNYVSLSEFTTSQLLSGRQWSLPNVQMLLPFLVDYYFLEEAGRIIDSAHRGFLTIGRDTRDRRQKVRIFSISPFYFSNSCRGSEQQQGKGGFPSICYLMGWPDTMSTPLVQSGTRKGENDQRAPDGGSCVSSAEGTGG